MLVYILYKVAGFIALQRPYKMNKRNRESFPGHGNQKSESSGCKIDLSFDLLTGCPVLQILDKATTQDKKLGRNLVDVVQERDLMLRDMGYFSVKEFQRIEDKMAFWLSRLPANVCAFLENGKELDELLKSFFLTRSNQKMWPKTHQPTSNRAVVRFLHNLNHSTKSIVRPR